MTRSDRRFALKVGAFLVLMAGAVLWVLIVARADNTECVDSGGVAVQATGGGTVCIARDAIIRED